VVRFFLFIFDVQPPPHLSPPPRHPHCSTSVDNHPVFEHHHTVQPPPHLLATVTPSCSIAVPPPLRHLAPLPSATTTIHSSHTVLCRCYATATTLSCATAPRRRRAFSHCCRWLIQVDVMGHDKRKGKELVAEPLKKKKTRT
jgi:hypothetical protein